MCLGATSTQLHSAGSSKLHVMALLATWDSEAGELLASGSSLPAWLTWQSPVTNKPASKLATSERLHGLGSPFHRSQLPYLALLLAFFSLHTGNLVCVTSAGIISYLVAGFQEEELRLPGTCDLLCGSSRLPCQLIRAQLVCPWLKERNPRRLLADYLVKLFPCVA